MRYGRYGGGGSAAIFEKKALRNYWTVPKTDARDSIKFDRSPLSMVRLQSSFRTKNYDTPHKVLSEKIFSVEIQKVNTKNCMITFWGIISTPKGKPQDGGGGVYCTQAKLEIFRLKSE